MEAQTISVKRAQVEFHNFASLGEPDRALAVYAEENNRRGLFLRKHLDFVGSLTPFLEIGANAGHTSYMFANEFGAEGFALDISADALRHGMALQHLWGLSRAPVRVAGDALNLPFKDGALRMVAAFQVLSQFMDIEQVFVEVKRVLAPGGVFLFAEEPLKRLLTLRLYRCLYYRTMKPWERKLYDWGLLGYLVRDVIGAQQEESFGIRQNHTMGLKDWNGLIRKHFESCECEVFVPERGWGERIVKRLAVALDPHRSEWRAARLLGGTLAAACRKAGRPNATEPASLAQFEQLLRCPDCTGDLLRDAADTLVCTECGYRAPNEGGVFNLLRSSDRRELYPGDRDDVIDFTQPGHESRLLGGFYKLEGVFGNKYRWIGASAAARLKRMSPTKQRLRLRGHVHENSFAQGAAVTVEILANGQPVGRWNPDRAGLFVIEADLPEAEEYRIEINASPLWEVPTDGRVLSINISMIRLVPAD